MIFVSIHSLHRISKYKGKEGVPPKVYKLGSSAWQKLKQNTKKKVKDYFVKEGYFNAEVDLHKQRDTLLSNSVILRIEVNKNERVKIEEIEIKGNKVFSDNHK